MSVTTMESYIVQKGLVDRLPANHYLVDIGNGDEVAVSSKLLEARTALQELIDEAIVDYGVQAVRQIVTEVIDEYVSNA